MIIFTSKVSLCSRSNVKRNILHSPFLLLRPLNFKSDQLEAIN